MPYLKKEIHPIVKLIHGYGVTDESLGRILNTSTSTARRKRINPNSVDISDLKRLRTHGHITKEEILEAISKVI